MPAGSFHWVTANVRVVFGAVVLILSTEFQGPPDAEIEALGTAGVTTAFPGLLLQTAAKRSRPVHPVWSHAVTSI